jgi:hypothetical protein
VPAAPLDALALVVQQEAHAPDSGAGQHGVLGAQRAVLHHHGGDDAALGILAAVDDHALGGPVRVRGELEDLGLEREALDQLGQALAGGGRHLDHAHLAAPVLHHDALGRQLLAHLAPVGAGLVHLVDGHEQRHAGGGRVIDGLLGLLHDAVVAGDHQHGHVRELRAAGAHLGEGLVARRVQEGDAVAAGRGDVVGRGALRDAARLAGRDLGLAQRVQQRGLAVVHVAHDGHHRRPRLRLAQRLAAASPRRSRRSSRSRVAARDLAVHLDRQLEQLVAVEWRSCRAGRRCLGSASGSRALVPEHLGQVARADRRAHSMPCVGRSAGFLGRRLPGG